LDREMRKRPKTYEGDLDTLEEEFQADVPAARMMKPERGFGSKKQQNNTFQIDPGERMMMKIREIQQGSFKGKPANYKLLADLETKFKLDEKSMEALTRTLMRVGKEQGKVSLNELDSHLENSNKPSAMVMKKLAKIKEKESLGSLGKASEGSYKDMRAKSLERVQADLKNEFGTTRDRSQDRGRSRSRGRGKDRGGRRDRDSRSQDRGRDRGDREGDRGGRRDRDRGSGRGRERNQEQDRDAHTYRDRDRSDRGRGDMGKHRRDDSREPATRGHTRGERRRDTRSGDDSPKPPKPDSADLKMIAQLKKQWGHTPSYDESRRKTREQFRKGERRSEEAPRRGSSRRDSRER